MPNKGELCNKNLFCLSCVVHLWLCAHVCISACMYVYVCICSTYYIDELRQHCSNTNCKASCMLNLIKNTCMMYITPW